ncbi:hypothetical protein EVAR_93090_1 [Eumeta japonica]|uniref:Uncharacterized protein n=1 Tax=Eumeta variegata TaxID=151549 RepID=A0A4C1TG53_EUMVA|nr:hypothetical protein EVAR_93090_1 [Eumeta japonica]
MNVQKILNTKYYRPTNSENTGKIIIKVECIHSIELDVSDCSERDGRKVTQSDERSTRWRDSAGRLVCARAPHRRHRSAESCLDGHRIVHDCSPERCLVSNSKWHEK